MPIKSKQQLKMMFASLKNKSNNKYGPSKEVAKEMLDKTSSSEKKKLMKMK